MPGLRSRRLSAFLFACLLAGGSPALGWTARTREAIAREGARLAPPDLARQLDRHGAAYLVAVEAAIAPSGGLERQLAAEVDAAAAAIQQHRAFEEVAGRLGAVARLVADLNDPLAAADGDAEEARYAADYQRYLESAEPRFPLVFYGLRPEMGAGRPDAARLAGASLVRARGLYPSIGLEYRRIGFVSGVGRFDDRSTAFAVGSLSFSHAVTDLVSVYRSIWLRAGGADDRGGLLPGAGRLFQVRREPPPRARPTTIVIQPAAGAGGGTPQ